MVVLIVAVAAFLACLLAEWLHARRARRAASLAFGPQAQARAWIGAVPFARAAALGLLVWGMGTLLTIDGAAIRREDASGPPQHLVICLDVSPSMYLQDSGSDGKSTRAARARDVLRSVLERLDMARTRVSVVAFYTAAKPVVVDTRDLNVVDNILGDLPLEHAFKEGPTNMYAGVRAAADLARPWGRASAALIVVSDGDTLPDAVLPALPGAYADSIVLGVGDPFRGRQIAGHASRQDASSLKRLAVRLHGHYHDGNVKHLASSVIGGLAMVNADAGRSVPLRTLALIAIGLGAGLLAGIAPALAAFGAPASVGARERAVRAAPHTALSVQRSQPARVAAGVTA